MKKGLFSMRDNKFTNELLDQLKQRFTLTSDYKLAAFLGITRQRVSGYRTKGHTIDYDLGLYVAELLGMDAQAVTLKLLREREHNPTVIKALDKYLGVA